MRICHGPFPGCDRARYRLPGGGSGCDEQPRARAGPVACPLVLPARNPGPLSLRAPSDEQGPTGDLRGPGALPTGAMGAPNQGQSVPQLRAGLGVLAALGGSGERGSPSLGVPLAAFGMGRAAALRCPMGCAHGVVSPRGVERSLWSSLGFVGHGSGLTGSRGTGTGSAGTLLEEADVPPGCPALWGCTCSLASERRNACAGKESAWELSGDFPGTAAIWEFSALPLVPSFLAHTLLPGSQTALKKATAHTMLFPSAAGAGDEIPCPKWGHRISPGPGKGPARPCQLNPHLGAPVATPQERDSGSCRCILPWGCSAERNPSPSLPQRFLEAAVVVLMSSRALGDVQDTRRFLSACGGCFWTRLGQGIHIFQEIWKQFP